MEKSERVFTLKTNVESCQIREDLVLVRIKHVLENEEKKKDTRFLIMFKEDFEELEKTESFNEKEYCNHDVRTNYDFIIAKPGLKEYYRNLCEADYSGRVCLYDKIREYRYYSNELWNDLEQDKAELDKLEFVVFDNDDYLKDFGLNGHCSFLPHFYSYSLERHMIKDDEYDLDKVYSFLLEEEKAGRVKIWRSDDTNKSDKDRCILEGNIGDWPCEHYGTEKYINFSYYAEKEPNFILEDCDKRVNITEMLKKFKKLEDKKFLEKAMTETNAKQKCKMFYELANYIRNNDYILNELEQYEYGDSELFDESLSDLISAMSDFEIFTE